MTPRLGRVVAAKVKECVNPRCPDTGASRIVVHRHHTGCDKMWVRHLLTTQAQASWVQALAIRYDQFHADDIVLLCIMCHEEMHLRYMPHIKLMTHGVGIPIAHMSEARVKRNIQLLRDRCVSLLRNGFVVRKSIINDYYKTKHCGR